MCCYTFNMKRLGITTLRNIYKLEHTNHKRTQTHIFCCCKNLKEVLIHYLNLNKCLSSLTQNKSEKTLIKIAYIHK